MPFGKDLPAASLSRHKTFDEATARIRWAIDQHQVAVLTGEVGAGKTFAVKAALETLEPARHLVIYIPNPTITSRGVNMTIASSLGAKPQWGTGPLTHQTARLLACELDEKGRLPIVIVDEAHMLTDRELETLRMLTNTAMDSASTFTLILVGQPTLRRRLKMAVLAALDQRIAVRYHMTGMDLKETNTYIGAHLAWAGRSDRLFSDDAVAALHRASRGHPRAVNNLAIASMVAAYAQNKAIIDQTAAEAAIIETTT